MQYSVKNPHDSGGHIVYEVHGMDDQGEWEGLRRFNEFYVLFECISKRWPGVPIPSIPPKKDYRQQGLSFHPRTSFLLGAVHAQTREIPVHYPWTGIPDFCKACPRLEN